MKLTIKVINPYALAPEADKIQTITGELIALPVATHLQFIVYRYSRTLWRTVEATTGRTIGDTYGATKRESIDKASRAITLLNNMELVNKCVKEFAINPSGTRSASV